MATILGLHRQSTILILLAAGCLLASPDLARQPPQATTAESLDPLEPPRLVVRLGRGTLDVQGTSASGAAETDLRRLAQHLFPEFALDFALQPGVALPGHWGPASEGLFEVVSTLQAGELTLTADSVNLRGVTAAADMLAERVRSLQEVLGDSATVTRDVEVLAPSPPVATLCRRSFAALDPDGIEFRQASADIRPSSFAVLDQLVEFAYDCRGHRIAITGHSDSTGAEAWNLRLSEMRAAAVADYLVRGGVEPERLLTFGKGSSEPVAANDTPHGRSLNRRIEIELAP